MTRRIVGPERLAVTLQAQETQGAAVLAQTAGSLKIFGGQYTFGRRPLMEPVGMFETFTAMEREQVALQYDMAILNLQIAKLRGVLVDGTRM